jgi:hypothetical protein
MKTITYLGGGPPVVSMGDAGVFELHQPRPDIDDALATLLVNRPDLKFTGNLPAAEPAPASAAPKPTKTKPAPEADQPQEG